MLNAYIPYVLLGAVLYCWVLLKYSEIALFVSVLVILNCFGLIHEDFLRLPFFFRIRDVFFLSIFLPLLIGIYKKDEKIRYVFFNPIARGIYLILFLAIIQIFITKLRFPGESVNSIVRMGRKYFYYAMFFPSLYILLDEKRFARFAKLFVGSILIFCCLFILQALLGPSHRIFLFGRVEQQILQGSRVVRMYLSGITAPALIFQIAFMLWIFSENLKHKLSYAFITMLSGLQIMLTMYRAHIFGIIMGTLFVFMTFRRKLNLTKLIKPVLVVFFILFFEIAFSKAFFPKGDLLKTSSVRMGSIYNAVRHQSDTFGVRIKAALGTMDLIKNNSVFGIGFVHDESDLFARYRGNEPVIRGGESGLISLLVDFGIIGVVWLLIMAFIVLKRGRYGFKIIPNDTNRLIVLGIIAYYFGRLFSFITQADPNSYDGIVIIVLSLACLENLLYQNQKRKRVPVV